MTVSSRGRHSSRLRRALLIAVPPLVLAAVIVVLWQWYVVANDVRPQVLPSPGRVVRKGWEARADIWANTQPTLQVTPIGFARVAGRGLDAGAVLIDFSSDLRRALMPVLSASQTLPIIAIAPLMIIWFGFGLMPKVLAGRPGDVLPDHRRAHRGLRRHRAGGRRDLLRRWARDGGSMFRYVRLPTALPFFFAGLRIAITYAVVGAIFAEYVGAKRGPRHLHADLQKNSFRTDLVLAAVLVTALAELGLFRSRTSSSASPSRGTGARAGRA